jgi:hypothetical protein
MRGSLVFVLLLGATVASGQEECPKQAAQCADRGNSCQGALHFAPSAPYSPFPHGNASTDSGQNSGKRNSVVLGADGDDACDWGAACVAGTCRKTPTEAECSGDSDCALLSHMASSGIGAGARAGEGAVPRGASFFEGFSSAPPFSSRSFVCEDGKCIPQLYASDDCSTASKCAGKMGCTSGVCEGLAKDEKCSVDGECDMGLFCRAGVDKSAGRCASAPADGDACQRSMSGDGCDRLSVCVGRTKNSDGVCRAAWSAKEGEACAPGACHFGLSCSAGKVCKKLYNADQMWDACSKADVDSGCAGNSKEVATCSCHPLWTQPACQPADEFAVCAREGSMMASCLKNKHCGFDILGADSCAQRECKALTNSFLECECGVAKKQFGSCYFADADICNVGVLPVWAVVLIAVGAVVATVALIAAIYYFGHKKRCYCGRPNSKTEYRSLDSDDGSSSCDAYVETVHGDVTEDCCSSESSCHSAEEDDCAVCSESDAGRSEAEVERVGGPGDGLQYQWREDA